MTNGTTATGATTATDGATATDGCPFASGLESVHWDQDLSYGSYLALDELLRAQRPRSSEHDEMLFIVIHQASELWMKLAVFEIEAAMRCIAQDDVQPALKMMARVARIQQNLTQSWSILSTLTPSDYMKFRPMLGQSSGFQSHQYRLLEFRLGNKSERHVRVHRAWPERERILTAALREPSLYDLVLQLLARHGLPLPAEALDRDWSQPYAPSTAVEDAWLAVYRDTGRWWVLYDLAEKLVDLEHQFQQWRFMHLKTVERIIGHKQGTGGTSGVSYLVKALDLRFFPELWTVRTRL
jgi:tryptophan 2,3-dioxygenase